MPFATKYYAHRGLHSPGVPENSAAALMAAKAAGYGAELDIRLDGGGEIVVFHDGDFLRMTGFDGAVHETPSAKVRELRLAGTDEDVPYFAELAPRLAPMPLIVELKSCPLWTALCEKSLPILRGYRGEAVMESFDPRIVRWFYKNAPDIKRGLLLSKVTNGSIFRRWFINDRAVIRCCRPHFLAVSTEIEKSERVRRAVATGLDLAVWTIREPSETEADAVIFEGYRP